MAAALSTAAFTPRFHKPISTTGTASVSYSHRCLSCRAESRLVNNIPQEERKKVVVVGSGWAGLASAHHLTKQGFDVTVLKVDGCHDEDIGVGGNGFRFPYRNIFSIIDELGIQPFTKWAKSAQYSTDGMEVEVPVFQDFPKLPTPLGAFLYPRFHKLPLMDQLSALPLMAAVIDFDNTDTAWRKYDAMTARELLKQFGCSRRLFQEVLDPMLQVGMFAPTEQCSAAATLGMLYYYFFAHQQNFDVVWCRGTIQDKIYMPWQDHLKDKDCNFVEIKNVLDFFCDKDTGSISGLICPGELLKADAVILAVDISGLQSLVNSSSVLSSKEDFLNVLHLSATDVISVKLWFDKKVDIPNPGNIFRGFDSLIAWSFFDLSAMYDEYEDNPFTVIKADFYYANQLLPLKDEQIVAKVISYLSKCIKGFGECNVLQQVVKRFPKSATHFFPGSYKYMMRGSTSIPNLFMAGDWVVTRHGSWSQEKAFVTGLEAANLVVDYLGEGDFAKIIAVEEDEPHIETLRILNRSFNEIKAQAPLSDFFLQ